MRPHLLIINGSLGGETGNTAQVIARMKEEFTARAEIEVLTLVLKPSIEDIEKKLLVADGFVFATGTYWDSWGSPLQSFFENATSFEAGDVWLGKPAAALMTMHSVGGKEVLSRLQGVLSTLGVLIPPMSGLAYSLTGHLALQGPKSDFQNDIWQLDDLRVVASNLLLACEMRADAKTKNLAFQPWPVDSSDPYRRWL